MNETCGVTIYTYAGAAQRAAKEAGFELVREVPHADRSSGETWWQYRKSTTSLDIEGPGPTRDLERGSINGISVLVRAVAVDFPVVLRQSAATGPWYVRFTPVWTAGATRQAFGGGAEAAT